MKSPGAFGPTRRWLGQRLSLLNIGAACALLVLWTFVGYSVHRAREDAIHDATVKAVGEAHVFAEYSRSTLRRIDEYLIDLRSSWQGQRDDFAELVQRRHAAVSDISFQVAVIDREGYLAFSTLAAGPGKVDLRDREHFRVHADDPQADTLFVSDALKGKVSQKWSIQFTRPVLKDGRFDGVIVISVGPEQFASFSNDLKVETGGVVTMVKDSGRIIARQPLLVDSLGRLLHDVPFLDLHRPVSGSFQLKAQSDGVDRIYGFHRLPEYGLTAVVGESMERALVPYTAQRNATLRAAVAITLLLAVLYALLRRLTAERQRAEDQRRIASLVYEGSSEGMVVTTADGLILSVNPAFTVHTGYTAEEVLGQTPAILRSGRQDDRFYAQMWEQIEATGRWQGEIWNRRKNGEIYPQWLTINTTSDADGKTVRRVGLFSDITEKKRSDELIWRQANFDSLTGLPNRRMFNDRLEVQIRRAHRTGQSFALLLLDLDRFKEVNDSLGHPAGDALLKEVAARLQACVRETDTVARLGGDEFTVILGEPSNGEAVQRVVESFQKRIAMPFHLQGETLFTTASVGVTFYPQDASDPQTLVKQADQAMFAAKALGLGHCRFFTAEMQEEVHSRMRLIADLRQALPAQQFRLHYQPIVDLTDGGIRKAEALLRWTHPTRGLVPPSEFIPLAEECGLIAQIGNWVFEQALADLARWQQVFPDGFQVSINLSALQLRGSGSAVDGWPRRMEALGIPRRSLVVEITESSLMEERDSVCGHLAALREAGLQLALDDFGTGYSSLAYLRKFDVDYLKIDQSFVQCVERSAHDQAMCEAIVALAHKIGVEVVAEGVETPAQRDFLSVIGCDLAQGFLMSRPLPAAELEALMAAQAGRSPVFAVSRTAGARVAG